MPKGPTKQQGSTSAHKTGQVSSGLIDVSFCNFYVQDSLVLQEDTYKEGKTTSEAQVKVT